MQKLKKNSTKIIYIVNQFYMHGGIQRMLSHKIDAWIENYGYEVTVITVNQNNNPVIYPPKHDFNLIDFGLSGVNSHNFLDLWLFKKKLKKVLRQESPALVITTLTGLPSLLLPFIECKIKKVLEIHSSGDLSVTKNWKYKWQFLNHYHKVVLLNDDEKKYYNLTNLAVIPNFIDLGTDEEIDYLNRDKTIVAAGRIHPDKQYGHLIKIWEKIFLNYPDWNVEVYGNGDAKLLAKYQNYIREKSIPRIDFRSATDQLHEVLKSSSLFVLTSETECFPMVLIECKKAMLPAISYDSSNGPRHIISDDGILVEHNNIEKFGQELGSIIFDEKRRAILSENAYKNRHLFSCFEIIKEWNELI